MKRICCFLVVILMLAAARSNAQFSFVSGDFYSSADGSDLITQYTPAGSVAGSLAVSGAGSVRGIEFGQDGLLYADTVQGGGFSVFAMNSAGTVEQTYSSPVYIEGNVFFGQVAVNSQYLYVGGQNELTQFAIGQPSSGTVIYQNNQIFGIAQTPTGNLWVASAYEIQEITPAGSILATVPGFFTDIRGIAYDAAANSLFVSELGNSGSGYFELLRLNAATGAVQAGTTYTYGANLFLTQSGDLLVGSWTQTAGIFNENLQQIGTLNNGVQMFVTADQVPEPAAMPLLAVGAVFGLAFRFRSLWKVNWI